MTTTSRIQIPIRISHEQHQRFTSVSIKTGIPMSVIARNALEKYIADIETNGIRIEMNDTDMWPK